MITDKKNAIKIIVIYMYCLLLLMKYDTVIRKKYELFVICRNKLGLETKKYEENCLNSYPSINHYQNSLSNTGVEIQGHIRFVFYPGSLSADCSVFFDCFPAKTQLSSMC